MGKLLVICFFISLFVIPHIATGQLLNNEGFEGTYTGVAPGWFQNTWGSPVAPNVQYSRESSIVHSGGSAQKITVNDLGDGGTILIQYYDFPAGNIYDGEIWLRSDSSMKVAFMFQESVPGYFVPSAVVKQIDTGWQRLHIRGGYDRNIGNDNTLIQGRFVIQPLGKGVLYVDDAAFADITQSVLNGPVPDTAPIPATYFGMHLNKLGVHQTYPLTNPGMIRLWNTGTEWADVESYSGAMLDPQNWVYNSGANNGYRLDYYANFIQTKDPSAEMIYTMGQSPSWAALHPWLAPSSIADWQNYVSVIGNRYHNKIRYWEIWNEVNYGSYSGSVGAMDSLAQTAYTVLKSIDPANQVLTPNATGPEWFAHYFNDYGGGHEDIISWHHYPGRNPEESIPEIIGMLNLMENYGLQDKPLWNTEGAVSVPASGTFNGEEAAAVSRTCILQWAYGVKNFNWYAWDIFGSTTNEYARLSASITPNHYDSLTAAGIAYRQTALWLKGAGMRAKSVAQDTWTIALERPGGYKAWIVWNTAGPHTFNIPASWNIIQSRDLSGMTAPVSASSVQIGTHPILLENSNALNVREIASSINYWLAPNPAMNSCTIHIDSKYADKEWTLHFYNSYGQLVKTPLDITQDEAVVHRGVLPAGIYFFVITSKDGSRASGKLIFD